MNLLYKENKTEIRKFTLTAQTKHTIIFNRTERKRKAIGLKKKKKNTKYCKTTKAANRKIRTR